MNKTFPGEEEILKKMIDTMFELPSGTVISTVGLLDKIFGKQGWDFDTNQLFQLAIDLPPMARKAGIRIGSPYKEPCEIGMPFVAEMIIRHRKTR